MIERGIIFCKGNELLPENLPLELKNGGELEPAASANLGKVSLVKMEKFHIINVLNLVNGNKSQAARILDISRSTLREKLKTYQGASELNSATL